MDDKNRIKRQIIIFLVITFASSFLFAFLCPRELMDQTQSPDSPLGVLIFSFFPALSALLTRAIEKEQFTYRALWLESPNGKGVQYSLMGLYGVFFIILVGHAIFFLFNRSFLNTKVDFTDVRYTLISTVFVVPVVLSGALIMGEELGWRGYLLPKLSAVWGVVPATIATGLIWACWHIPLLVIADQTGVVPHGGVFYSNWIQGLITVYFPLCLSMSMICSFITLKSGSALAAGCTHASYNIYITAFNVLINYDYISNFSINRPFYYVIILLFIVGVPMMVHLHKLEKQGKLNLVQS